MPAGNHRQNRTGAFSFASYDDRFTGADATHALRQRGRPRGHAAGIGLMLAAVLLFSLNDVLGKWLVASYAVGQVLVLRSAASLAVLAPLAWRVLRRPATGPRQASGASTASEAALRSTRTWPTAAAGGRGFPQHVVQREQQDGWPSISPSCRRHGRGAAPLVEGHGWRQRL